MAQSEDIATASGWSNRRIACTAFVAYALLAIILTYPLIFSITDKTPANYNSVNYVYLFAQQSRLFFQEHPLDFYAAFSPEIMIPVESPLFFAGTSFLTSMLFAPAYLATNNLYLATNVLLLLMSTLSAFSFFLLAWDVFRCPRAAFVAGFVFSFTTGTLFFLKDMLALNTFLVPLILLTFRRYLLRTERRMLVLCAFLLGLEFHVHVYHFVQIFYVLVALGLIHWRRFWCSRAVLDLFLAMAVSLAIALPVAYPCLQLAHEYRGFGPLQLLHWDSRESLQTSATPVCLAASVALGDWFAVGPSNVLYGDLLVHPSPRPDDVFNVWLFPGFVVLLLVIRGLRGRSDEVLGSPFLAGLLVVAFLTMTGTKPLYWVKQGPTFSVGLDWLSRILPAFWIVRVPFRMYLLLSIALGMLVCQGLVKQGRLARGWLFAAVMLLVMLENLAIPLPLYDYDAIFGPLESDLWLRRTSTASKSAPAVLHLPSWTFTFPADVTNWDFQVEEGLAPLFRHLQHGRPTPNGCLSFCPKQLFPLPMMGLPSRYSLAYFAALGTRYVVVHPRLLRGKNRQRLSHTALQGNGLQHVHTTGEGDRIYEVKLVVHRAQTLVLDWRLSGTRWVLQAATPSAYQRVIKQQPLPREDDGRFFVDTAVSRWRSIVAVVRLSSGEEQSRTFSFSTPRVMGPDDILELGSWPVDGKGTLELVRLETTDSWFTVPPGVHSYQVVHTK